MSDARIYYLHNYFSSKTFLSKKKFQYFCWNKRRRDIQHNDTQHYDIQHYDTRYIDIQHNSKKMKHSEKDS